MKLYIRIFSWLAFTLFVTGLFSCRTTKPTVDTKDLSYIYNPTKSSFRPAYSINSQSDQSAMLTVRFLSNDLFFSEANPEGVPTAGVIISVKLYQTEPVRALVDTISYNINIVKDGNRREYIYNLPLKTDAGKKYVAELKILDRLRMMVSQIGRASWRERV